MFRKKTSYFTALLFFLNFNFLKAQVNIDEGLLHQLMRSRPGKFNHILQNPDEYEVQIIYTQIFRDSLNLPFLKDHGYRLNPNTFFHCASLVKLPTAILSLQKINEMTQKGINKYTRMENGAAYSCQTPTILNGKNYLSVAKYIEQMLLVSDNDAYTRLYEFLGQEYIQKKLNERGYERVRITRRFNQCDTLQNRYTNPIYFYDENGKMLWTQEQQYNNQPFVHPLGRIYKGKGYTDAFGRMVPKPMDFTHDNFLSLRDIHDLLISVIMPEVMQPSYRFQLNEEDYAFLRRCLGSYPGEAKLNTYKKEVGYYDTYKKYLFYGRAEKAKANLRIFNIVGWWSGFVSDCAYFVDFDKKIEFFLSAVIYVNKDNIFNLNEEYQSIGFPFLADLGKLIYDYEHTLRKKYSPDLRKFSFF